MDEMQSSSPDPLGHSYDSHATSPLKPNRPTISPRKPLANASGNARTQDFIISTPPAKRKNSFLSSPNKYQDDLESPWRIRLTVQTERVDDERGSAFPGALLQGTTTTTIPLKGGDGDSPPVKRGRGRPRKSLEGRNANGTPGAKANPLRNKLPDFDSSSVMESWAPTPPRKSQIKQRRKRISSDTTSAADEPVIPLSSPRRATPERTVKARPFSRSRSRSRRKEITPRKMGFSVNIEQDSSSGSEEPVSPLGQQLPVLESLPSLMEANEEAPTNTSSLAILEQHGSSIDRSMEDIEDEQMWRAMIQKDSVSPPSERPEVGTTTDKEDPTEEHQDFDTILESEGFSMVSVESLQSTGSGAARLSSPAVLSYGTPSIMSGGNNTSHLSSPGPGGHEQWHPGSTKPAQNYTTPQVQEISPSMPAPPKQAVALKPGPMFHNSDGTPQQERVTRASAVLQSLPSPENGVENEKKSKLASPFDAGRKSATRASLSKPQGFTPTNSQIPNADLVCGFSAATRRELRAGLRLGEELAKRYQQSPVSVEAPEISSKRSQVKGDSGSISTKLGHGTFVGSHSYQSADMNASFRSNPQLPSPATSTYGGCDDKMSWKAEAPDVLTPGRIESVSTKGSAENLEIDYSMLAREAEWQREREAVSKQIREANSSQIVEIEDTEIGPSTRNDVDVGSSSQQFSNDLSSKDTSSLEFPRRTPEKQEMSDFAPFRRSKLPSPWMRQGKAEGQSQESSGMPNESDLFWQPDSAHLEANRKRVNRRKQREASQNSSQLAASLSEGSSRRGGRPQASASSRSQVDPTLQRNASFNISNYEPSSQTDAISDSLNANLSKIQPAGQLLNDEDSKGGQNSFLANSGNIQSRSALLADEELYPNLDSFEANKGKYLPVEQVECAEDSLAINKPNIQPNLPLLAQGDSILVDAQDENLEDSSESTEETIAEEETTVALAEDVPPAIVPLPGSPSLNAIDPDLQADTADLEDEVNEVATAMGSIYIQPSPFKTDKPQLATQTSSSWWSALTAPLTSLLISSPSCPAATKEDILVSSPYEPLPWYLPTTSAHLSALQPLVWSSTLYNPAIFPFNGSSSCRYVLGATISTGRGWAREITKADCGIIDAFRMLLRYRGLIPEEGRGLVDGERLTSRHIAGLIVRIWVQMVMEGYVNHREWKGVRTGMRKLGDRRWTERDVLVDEEDARFVQMRRRVFTEEGLPSWKARGWKGPFALAKPL